MQTRQSAKESSAVYAGVARHYLGENGPFHRARRTGAPDRLPVAIAACLAAALVDVGHADTICFSNFRILNEEPIEIHCGKTKVVNCQVDYKRYYQKWTWDNCWGFDDSGEKVFTAQLREAAFWSTWCGYEVYAETQVVVPPGPEYETTATVSFSFTLQCTYEQKCKDCKIVRTDGYAGAHEAQLYCKIDGLIGPGSTEKTFRCVCDSCAHAMKIGNVYAPDGTVASTPLTVERSFTQFQAFVLDVQFDPERYEFVDMSLADPALAEYTSVQPWSGGVVVSAYLPTPYDLPVGPFGELSIWVRPDAPWGDTPLGFSDDSFFMDPYEHPIDACLPMAMARNIPEDSSPPVIDLGRVHLTACGLSGEVGAVSDDHLGDMPQYVELTLEVEGESGATVVAPDGHFDMPNVMLGPGTPVTLAASDGAGNSVSAGPVELPSEPCYCQAAASICDEYIARVLLSTIDNQTGCGLGSRGLQGYSDYSAIVTSLAVDQSYPITVLNGPNAYVGDNIDVWCDWNGSGTFDADENVALHTSDYYEFTGTITVPSTAAARVPMRIRLDYFGQHRPCDFTAYGEIEDYTLEVSGGVLRGDLNCDGAVNTFDIDPFVLAMTDPAGYAAQFPGCNIVTGDTNCDGVVNVFDIDPFVLCLTAHGCPPCTPAHSGLGLLYAPGEADAPDFRAALSALLGQPVDYFDARAETPTVDEMSQYSAVMTWINYELFNNVAMGDNLADFADLDGAVILGQWCFPTAGNYLAGRIMTADYCPLAAAAGWGRAAYLGGGVDCVLQAGPVSALSGDYVDYITGLVPGAFADGPFDMGTPVAAWRPDRKVYYSPGNVGGMYGATGDWTQLTANFLLCGGGGGACCDDSTDTCWDGELPLNCPYRFTAGLRCAQVSPPCGSHRLCDHRVDLYDSYGDGWNGNTLDIYVNDVLVLTGITLPSGAGPLSFHFEASISDVIHTVYNAIGGWPYEPYYMIYDGQGNLIVQDGGSYVQPTGVTVFAYCELSYGACCEQWTGFCTDDVSRFNCPYPTYTFYPDTHCDVLSPPCGNPGACCDEWAGTCTDGWPALACASIPHYRFSTTHFCCQFNPPCGEVRGACCYETLCEYVRPVECDAAGGSYVDDGAPCSPNPCLCAVVAITAPGSWSGNTCGAGDDCALRAGEDLIVQVIIPTAGNWRFDLCTSAFWDTYMFLGTDCCASTWYDDDGCSTYSLLSILNQPALPAGTYYVDIEPYSSSSCGNVTLTVSNFEPSREASVPAKAAPTK